MNYQQSLDYIKSLAPTLERPTMARIKLYFEDLGKPQNQLACFHLGGTNGKGSVTTFLASMIGSCGKKVGKFTGPHLLKFNERIVVNGQDIDDQTFARVATTVLKHSQAFSERHPELGPLTWFEYLTAMAVEHFVHEKVDFAVFEVGLGGRFDATNALENILVSTIVNVDLDHMHLLGNTVEEIAGEKAGIIKHAPLVTAASGNALLVLQAAAAKAGVPFIVLDNAGDDFSATLFRDFNVAVTNASAEFEKDMQTKVALIKDHLLSKDVPVLSGAYQRLNALTALISLSASQFFATQLKQDESIFFANLSRGLTTAYWPGRYEIIEESAQILDGAHNPHGARALRLSLEDMFADKAFVFIFASFQNKDLRSVLSHLISAGDFVLVPKISGERAMHEFTDIQKVCQELKVDSLSFDTFEQAGIFARELIKKESKFAPMTIVTGSFATVREAKRFRG